MGLLALQSSQNKVPTVSMCRDTNRSNYSREMCPQGWNLKLTKIFHKKIHLPPKKRKKSPQKMLNLHTPINCHKSPHKSAELQDIT